MKAARNPISSWVERDSCPAAWGIGQKTESTYVSIPQTLPPAFCLLVTECLVLSVRVAPSRREAEVSRSDASCLRRFAAIIFVEVHINICC